MAYPDHSGYIGKSEDSDKRHTVAVSAPRIPDGPPISALTLTDNALTLRVQPGAAIGEPAAISFHPAIEFYSIENRVQTVAAGGAHGYLLRGGSGHGPGDRPGATGMAVASTRGSLAAAPAAHCTAFPCS